MVTGRYIETGILITFILLIGFCTRIDPALAQAEDEQRTATYIDEVVVKAQIERKIETEPATGIRIETVFLRRPVSYADLDLSKNEDVLELERRIEMLASESCEELEKMFPLERDDVTNIRRCTRMAVKGTEDELRNVVAAAN